MPLVGRPNAIFGVDRRFKYQIWVPFDELPKHIAAADICLGGPFGDTLQSRVGWTGKTVQ